jgi:hypothetical protein
MEVSMDNSLSRHPVKPSKIGILHRVGIWFQACTDASKHKKGSLPIGTLEPGIARIQQVVEKRNRILAAISVEYRHRIPSALNQAEITLKRQEIELAKRQRVLDDEVENYKAGHDGKEPPEHSAPIAAQASTWVVAGLFTIGELPLMSSALERLPVPDWQRFILAAGASALTIYLAHESGIWLGKPHKSLYQIFVSWLLVTVLLAILTFAAFVRRDAMQNHKNSPANTAPQVFIRELEGKGTIHV